jgi:hypothetical protein
VLGKSPLSFLSLKSYAWVQTYMCPKRLYNSSYEKRVSTKGIEAHSVRSQRALLSFVSPADVPQTPYCNVGVSSSDVTHSILVPRTGLDRRDCSMRKVSNEDVWELHVEDWNRSLFVTPCQRMENQRFREGWILRLGR